MISDEVRETVGSMISCIAIPVWTLKLEDEKNALVMAILLLVFAHVPLRAAETAYSAVAAATPQG